MPTPMIKNSNFSHRRCVTIFSSTIGMGRGGAPGMQAEYQLSCQERSSF